MGDFHAIPGPFESQGAAPSASRQDGTHPRPQLLRSTWSSLNGPWTFRFDDADEGLRDGWRHSQGFPESITVPFPWESPASGIGDTGFHPLAWYQRELREDELEAAGHEPGRTLLLHFGAVDHSCDVWLDGRLLGRHEGGQTPFTFELDHALGDLPGSLVLRVLDDPHDLEQPRGKQDWHLEPHGIWYHRTSGIWQEVWLESVPRQHLERLSWTAHGDLRGVTAAVRTARRAAPGTRAGLSLWHDGELLAECESDVVGHGSELSLRLPVQAFDAGALRWSPGSPTLLDARVTLEVPGQEDDVADSYLGLRSCGTGRDDFLLNGAPQAVLGVLTQGYWPQSHLAAPSPEALRREVELIKELGFTMARVHQKAEDPRFLYWADRLGLMVWAEAAAPFVFSPESMRRSVQEWLDILERDSSHPCIVTWVPCNESWGADDVARSPAQRAHLAALAALTRARAPGVPVVSNDGWEHVDSDLLTVHDYEPSGEVVRERYRSREAVLAREFTAAGKPLMAGTAQRQDVPLMVTELGGISYAPDADPESWGYSSATSQEDFLNRLSSLMAGFRAAPALAGLCTTQLADTRQETNGLLFEDRTPKAPLPLLKEAVTGVAASPAIVAADGSVEDTTAPEGEERHDRVAESE
ncbi:MULTISPECIES: sugar-binding domain-containing protein [Arthrobacter]|uniref:Sugar-binding domain-containing protein n=2 Tax=Arthrobacter TaxID=1663 RepID=A0ABU9KJJ5_9MICC|nr:sugar-binding domain-containing protein [Arthrobacter sp. YJM1]MDP5227272.1 glycoside hydrolase family 2 TIM barrel-domain containing protein [Arthrobacter sp. YJM1]